MLKKIVFLGIVMAFLSATPVFAGPSYYIDSIYDSVNADNWFSTAPTLVGGQTYDVTISGHGEAGMSNPAQDVSMGLFIDWDGNIGPLGLAWMVAPETPALEGIAAYSGSSSDSYKDYVLSGSLTVPGDVETQTVAAMAYLDPDNELFTTGADAFWNASTLRFSTPPCLGVGVNLQANPVPEPGSLSLLSLGLFGLLGRFRKRS